MFRRWLLAALLAGAAVVGLSGEGEAGDVRGPQTRRGSLMANDRQDSFGFIFRGGEEVTVTLTNRSNRGDVNLLVVDANGRVVASDFRRDDDASVAFTPPSTGTFYVRVKYSRGKGRLNYTLRTN